jgi:serine phosphatase RsbU (regulator of sigma subunit)/energy-coupling factor transporter ATP-binding protein EcfA2
MTGLDGASEAAISETSVSETPSLAIYYGNVIEQIVQCVREGTYCALLGPRLSGKTHLLRHLDRILAESLGWTCIYIDLYTIKAFTLHGFFAELIDITAGRITELTGLQLATPEGGATSSAIFRGFLTDAVTGLGHDLILIIEHLEAVPTDLVQALLTSLRAAYMDQQTLECRVMVVISGALSLATLTIGESSPFRGIARRVFVGDLSAEESSALIVELVAAGGITASRRARRRLLRATKGDPYLIRSICQRCTEVVQEESSSRLGGRMVRRVIRGFLRDEVYQYAPLLEAVRVIEEDPDLLHSILLLLAHGIMPKSALPLPLSPDLDPLSLTGVVEQIGSDSTGSALYRIQNRIYHRFLTRHFHPGHVGHLLTMAGRWDPAIDYLEAAIQEGNEGARLDLLPAILNSIYAAEDVGQAARFLARGLSAAFGVVEARVWYAPPQENFLRMVGHLGPKVNGATDPLRSAASEMPIGADRLEARAYRQAHVLRGPEGTRHVWRAIPLPIPGQKPIGVVMLCDDLLGKRFAGQRERDLQLLGYLNQAARAMYVVSTRRQASLMPKAPPEVPGWQIAATLRPAGEASGDFYDFILLPGGRLGLVIADVVDKGMGAALYMALSRTIIRTYAGDYPDRPDLALRAANERILADTRSGLFVTVFYGILDPSAGTLTYCNAGHYPPYLLGHLPASTQEGDPVQALPGRGMALGVIEDTSWGHRTVELPPGATLLLYTDGVLDAQNPQEERFGSERVLEIAQSSLGRSAHGLQADLLARLQQFMGDAHQFDDMTLVTVVRAQFP